MDELRCPLEEAAARHAGRLAVLSSHRRYTFAQLHDYTLGAMGNIERAGLGEGDVVAVALPASHLYPVLLMALLRLGVVACPVNTRLPVQGLLDALAAVNCRDIICPYGVSDAAKTGALYALAPAALADERQGRPRTLLLSKRQPATIFFTSGTTGRPKAALHLLGNHYHSALAANANMPIEPGDRWLVSLPMHHVAGIGIVFRCLLAGAATVMPRPDEPLLDAIVTYRVTHVSLVATQLHRLLLDPGAADVLRRLKAILLGGGAIPPRLIERCVALGLPIHTSYGLTETASQVAATPRGATLDQLLTSGRPLTPDTIRINDGGEILVRGEALFAGYIEEGCIARRLTGDGWFPTGDLGRFTEDGCLEVTGRMDNMFVSGGENIQPEEIEAILGRMDGIEAAVVVPVPDDEFGQRPVAFLRVDGDRLPERDSIIAHVSRYLPRFKAPRLYLRWPDHLRDVELKPSRAELTRLAAKAPELRVRRNP